MIIDRTQTFIDNRKAACAAAAENIAIVHNFIEQEMQSGRAVMKICIICNGQVQMHPPPVCRHCILSHFLRAEGFCPPETYELCNMIEEAKAGAKDMHEKLGAQLKSLYMNRALSRCARYMCMNIARLVQTVLKKRMREREQRKRMDILMCHYMGLKNKYMNVLCSSEWDSLFALKSMLAEVLQNIHWQATDTKQPWTGTHEHTR